MPVIHSYQEMPAWSELKKYQVLELLPGKTYEIQEDYPQIGIIVLSGTCNVSAGETELSLKLNDWYTTTTGRLTLQGQPYYFVEKCQVMLVCGTWEHVHLDIFRVDKFENPVNPGTACDYYRNSSFDNHYHDFDEHWIVVSGEGVAYTEGKPFEVKGGDCIVTGMGHHHDFPISHTYITAVAVETTPMGEKREGHLWEHRDGKAVPQMDRI